MLLFVLYKIEILSKMYFYYLSTLPSGMLGWKVVSPTTFYEGEFHF